VAIAHTQAQTIRNKRLLAEKDPAVRKRNQDELRRAAEDPVRARSFCCRLRSSRVCVRRKRLRDRCYKTSSTRTLRQSTLEFQVANRGGR